MCPVVRACLTSGACYSLGLSFEGLGFGRYLVVLVVLSLCLRFSLHLQILLFCLSLCIMTNLDSILKSRDITLPTNVCPVKAMVFPVVIYGGESWTVMKVEHQKIDAFELWCWRRLFRVPWTARRPNQSILKEMSPEYSSEGLMLNLKLQYFGHLVQGTDSFVKLGKIEGGRRRGQQRMR